MAYSKCARTFAVWFLQKNTYHKDISLNTKQKNTFHFGNYTIIHLSWKVKGDVMPNQEVVDLRNRILGALIQNVRNQARVTVQECAAALGISEGAFAAYERGSASISLPELELLARFIEVPLSVFRETSLSGSRDTRLPNAEIFLPLRHRIVGARLRQVRQEARRTQQDLADILECSAEQIADYEYGRRSVPFAELEIVGRALTVSLEVFFDKESEVGQWHKSQDQFERFKKLSPEMRDFVLRPINESYLALAMKLSDMPAGALRAIAEGLLEITY
ncbi:MAG TPA: helix-turn-helix transcriptional regulator [Anaerolineae bacterium]|nr:helix-turn-helix transcriptional regulator [Anaerolineae bacterium]